MNIVILMSIVRPTGTFAKAARTSRKTLDMLLNKRGFLARIFRPVFRMVTKSWMMFPLGFLFGLGFDTATEVAVFGLTAAQARKGHVNWRNRGLPGFSSRPGCLWSTRPMAC